MPDKSAGGALKPVQKIHPIVNQRFVLCDYTEYENMIVEGQYSFPFTLHLPDWLPQSHLCFNTPEPKKPNILNTFKIRYNLIAVIEGTDAAAPVNTNPNVLVNPNAPRKSIVIKTEK